MYICIVRLIIFWWFCRLKCLLRLLEKGDVRPEVVQKNLKLAIQVLDSVYLDEAGRWVQHIYCLLLFLLAKRNWDRKQSREVRAAVDFFYRKRSPTIYRESLSHLGEWACTSASVARTSDRCKSTRFVRDVVLKISKSGCLQIYIYICWGGG